MAAKVSIGLASVERYLGSWPEGLDACPQCLHKGEPLAIWLEHSPIAGLRERLPAAVAPLLDRSRPMPTWVSEVHANVLYLAIRELHFDSDQAFLEHASRVNRAVLDTPTNRVLFWVSAPKAILRGSALRWSSLHRGSSFSTRIRGDTAAEVDIGFPANLFPKIVLLGMGTGFAAALENAGARDVVIALKRDQPNSALFTATWT
jgi:hypothetical protein